MIDLDSLVRAARDLEPLPASVGRLAALISDPRSEIKQVVDVVAFDQGLTARLLRMANSAMSASRRPVSTVREAVVRLGTGPVLSLTAGVHVKRRLKQAIPEYGLSEGDLWRHSVAAALAAESLPACVKVPVPAETFTAALLHDVGKLVLSRFLYPEVGELLTRAHREAGLTKLQAEVEILHTHHGELGGIIAGEWKLPETIVRGITYHHIPDSSRDTASDAVHIANVVAKAALAVKAEPEEGRQEAFARAAAEALPGPMQRLGLAEGDLATLTDMVGNHFEAVLAVYE